MMAGAIERAAADADAALERLRAQVAALLSPAPARTLRSERVVRRRRAAAILYVDDHALADHYGDVLRTSLPGCLVTVVSDAEEAIAAARSGSWTVAVLDLHLGHPRLTGLDVLAELPSSTRVVLVTGVLPEDLPEVARRAGVDAHLTKPFTPDELARAVAPLAAHPH